VDLAERQLRPARCAAGAIGCGPRQPCGALAMKDIRGRQNWPAENTAENQACGIAKRLDLIRPGSVFAREKLCRDFGFVLRRDEREAPVFLSVEIGKTSSRFSGELLRCAQPPRLRRPRSGASRSALLCSDGFGGASRPCPGRRRIRGRSLRLLPPRRE
jgi:hypothetical protein